MRKQTKNLSILFWQSSRITKIDSKRILQILFPNEREHQRENKTYGGHFSDKFSFKSNLGIQKLRFLIKRKLFNRDRKRKSLLSPSETSSTSCVPTLLLSVTKCYLHLRFWTLNLSVSLRPPIKKFHFREKYRFSTWLDRPKFLLSNALDFIGF